MDLASGIARFTVAQKITLMVNRYEIRTADDDGRPGDLVAFAQQKRAASKGAGHVLQGRIADHRPVLLQGQAEARRRRDLRRAGCGRATDRKLPQGLRRITAALHLAPRRARRPGEGHGAECRSRNRSAPLGDGPGDRRHPLPLPLPLRLHRPGGADGHDFGTREVAAGLVTVPGARLDGRVAAAMAVALDPLQSR